MSVERLARALGVWSDGAAVVLVGLARRHGAALIKVVGSDGFRVWTPTARTGLDQHWRLYVDPHDVDEGTAQIFLLALASGLKLDVGRCPACDGSKSQREDADADGPEGADHLSDYEGPGAWRVEGESVDPELWTWARPCSECSEPGPPIACQTCGGTALGRVEARGPFEGINGEVGFAMLEHPCEPCKGSGKQPGPPQPTGRRILGAEAILEAMDCKGSDPNVLLQLDPLFDRVKPGDQPTRDALAVHADRLQASGDPLGELLAAWLAGECRKCEGCNTICDHPAPESFGCTDCMNTGHLCAEPCEVCRGRGTVLGAMRPKLEALVERLAP